MKILLLSEGKHELGSDHPRSALESPLAILVRRLLGDTPIFFEREQLRAPTFRGQPIKVGKGKGLGFEKLLLTWMRVAEIHEFDAIVVVVDHDGDDNRIKAFNIAQANELFPIRRAFGIAIRTFDAWMLADEKALSDALCQVVPTQPSPEDESNPKRRCSEILDATASSLSQAEMYEKVASAVRLDMLQSRCSTGFKPFAERVRALRTASSELVSE
jgi:hypothetical protein